jgi:ATP-dependent RNA helicase MSS116
MPAVAVAVAVAVADSVVIPASGFEPTTTPPPAVAVAVAGPSASSSAPAAADGGTKLAHITDRRFADLEISSESRRALSEVFKYQFMTAVQAETLPLILKSGSQDCLAKAKTGTGKTLAFMIPTIEKITKKTNRRMTDINCLVISPTRELAQQITAETEKLLTFHKDHLRKVVTCVGGTNKNRDIKALRGSTPIVVATPGRLLDHLQNGDLASRMANLDCLILDEADQLLDMGFRPDVERILRLLQPSHGTRQTLLFSATIPDQVNEIANIALRPGWNFVDTVGEDSEQTHMHVQQQLMITSQDRLVHDLFCVLDRETSAAGGCYKIIVFFTTARLTGFMAEMFNSVSSETGYSVLEIHSRKAQNARERASEQFRKSGSAVLFSSDVSARGMDYPDVTFVLQVGLTDRSQYIHRLGRTARAGKDGKGGLLLADYEEQHMRRSELKDMPLELIAVPVTARVSGIAERAVKNVSSDKVLRNSAEQAYRAWLGYYNGHLKKVRWDKRRLVEQANMFGTEVGLVEQPSIEKRTVGKMGLKGVPGLKVV